MVFPGWRVELEETGKSSALRRISYAWLCQPHLIIKISDVGETQATYFQCFILLITRQKLPSLFLYSQSKSNIFALCTNNREKRLFSSFEKPIMSYQGGSQSLTVARNSSWKCMYPFENHLWTSFSLIIIAYEAKQSLFAFLSC